MFQSDFFHHFTAHSDSLRNLIKSFFEKIFNRSFRPSNREIRQLVSDIQEFQEMVRQKRTVYENWKKSDSAKTENCNCGKLKFSVAVGEDGSCSNQELIDRCNQLDLVFLPPKLLTGFAKDSAGEIFHMN
ncbi:MAG: hypothetical protein WBF83_03275 [Moheibacter sp.]